MTIIGKKKVPYRRGQMQHGRPPVSMEAGPEKTETGSSPTESKPTRIKLVKGPGGKMYKHTVVEDTVNHHFSKWMNSPDAPRDSDSGDDHKVTKMAKSYLRGTKVPSSSHDTMADKLSNKFHGMNESTCMKCKGKGQYASKRFEDMMVPCNCGVKISESVEDLQEVGNTPLGKAALARYIMAAHVDASHDKYKLGVETGTDHDKFEKDAINPKGRLQRADRRSVGINRAANRLGKENYYKFPVKKESKVNEGRLSSSFDSDVIDDGRHGAARRSAYEALKKNANPLTKVKLSDEEIKKSMAQTHSISANDSDYHFRKAQYAFKKGKTVSEEAIETFYNTNHPLTEGRRLKTGPISNHPHVGREVQIRLGHSDMRGNAYGGKKGTITMVSREHTFSQMVPYLTLHHVKIDGEDKAREFHKRSVKMLAPKE